MVADHLGFKYKSKIQDEQILRVCLQFALHLGYSGISLQSSHGKFEEWRNALTMLPEVPFSTFSPQTIKQNMTRKARFPCQLPCHTSVA